MAVISNNVETSTPDSSADKTLQRRSQQYPRRRRSIRSFFRMVNRNIDKVLRSRRLFPTVIVLLLLFGFVHVSRINNVLGPKQERSYFTANVGSSVGYDDFAGPASNAMSLSQDNTDQFDERPEVELQTNGSEAAAVNPLANTWKTVDLRSLDLLPILAIGTPDTLANDKQPISDTRGKTRSSSSTATYVVNEGGSLWGAAKRFIDDEALLNKLIDNLAENGMDVRSVRPGVAFVVKDLGSEGMSVMVDSGGYRYESYIVAGNVTTSIVGEAKLLQEGLGS